MYEEDEYDSLHADIENWLQKMPVNDWSFNFLKTQLTKLGHLKHKNREKTQVLTVKVFKKFKDFSHEEIFSEYNNT